MKRLFFLLAAGLLAFAGCATGTASSEEQFAERQYRGLALDWKHSDSPQANASKLNPPYASWVGDDRSMFVITTFGSETCPYTPVIVEVVDDRTIEMLASARRPTPSVCLANFTPTTFVFMTPKGIAGSGDVEVVATWHSHDGSTKGTTSGVIRE